VPTAQSPRHPRRLASLVCSLVAFGAAGCAPLPYVLTDMKEKIVGIDVALEPDAALVDRTHAPEARITLVRSFIRSTDVHSLSAAVAHVLATTDLEGMNLRASGYQSGNWNGTSGTALTVDASPELRRLEEQMVAAVSPFILNTETARDFIVTADGSAMHGSAIDAIDHFVPESSGVNYRPHVIASSMQGDTAKRAQSQPFEAFTFRPVGVSMYQIGGDGQSRRLLWKWNGEPGAK